jgi:hypothetical protein
MLEVKYKNDDENEVHTSITYQRKLFVFRRDDKGPRLNYMEAKAYNPLQGIENVTIIEWKHVLPYQIPIKCFPKSVVHKCKPCYIPWICV